MQPSSQAGVPLTDQIVSASTKSWRWLRAASTILHPRHRTRPTDPKSGRGTEIGDELTKSQLGGMIAVFRQGSEQIVPDGWIHGSMSPIVGNRPVYLTVRMASTRIVALGRASQSGRASDAVAEHRCTVRASIDPGRRHADLAGAILGDLSLKFIRIGPTESAAWQTENPKDRRPETPFAAFLILSHRTDPQQPNHLGSWRCRLL